MVMIITDQMLANTYNFHSDQKYSACVFMPINNSFCVCYFIYLLPQMTGNDNGNLCNMLEIANITSGKKT